MTLKRPLAAASLLAVLAVLAGCAAEHEISTFPVLIAYDPPNDKGDAVKIGLKVPLSPAWLPTIPLPTFIWYSGISSFRVERAESEEGPFANVGADEEKVLDAKSKTLSLSFTDQSGSLDIGPVERGVPYYYRVVAATVDGREKMSEVFGPVEAGAEWWDTTKIASFLAIAVFAALVWWFVRAAKRDPKVYVREIGGLAAMSEAIGRATEMGKPVLFVPGIADMDDIQTITALVIMRQVAKQAAEYETPVIVPCRSPVVLTAAEEAVKTGCMEAGRPEIYNPDNVRFLSDEQFAFTAATNGIMLREHPATNIYLGAFWAESLILAETGFLAGAIQIAGTANVAQLPFFVAACDYTLIGEELYAASAYLSREPMLMGSLKGSDWAKVLFAFLILVGVVMVSSFKPPIWKAFVEFFK